MVLTAGIAETKKRVSENDCYKCKQRVLPQVDTLDLTDAQKAAESYSSVHATCPNCASQVNKILNKTHCHNLRECVDTNTSLLSLDEADRAVLADIGIKPEIPRPE